MSPLGYWYDYLKFWAAKVIVDVVVIMALLLLIGGGWLILYIVQHNREKRP